MKKDTHRLLKNSAVPKMPPLSLLEQVVPDLLQVRGSPVLKIPLLVRAKGPDPREQ